MFKKTILTLMLIFALVLIGADDSNAIDDVGFGGGSILIMEKGKTSEFGSYITGRFPLGINSKSITQINQHAADTNITFEVVADFMVVHSDFDFSKYKETEAEVGLLKIRKTLGFWSSYLEGGVTAWMQRVTSPDENNSNVTRDGYYAGFGIKPFGMKALKVEDVIFKMGAHVIPITDGPDLYAFQLGFSLLL